MRATAAIICFRMNFCETVLNFHSLCHFYSMKKIFKFFLLFSASSFTVLDLLLSAMHSKFLLLAVMPTRTE